MKLLTLAGYVLILVIGLWLIIALHEQVHVQIFRSYGIHSEVSWTKVFPNVVTTPDKPCPNDFCTLAHNINEIVGYTAQAIYIGFASLWIYLRMSLEEIE